MASQAKALVFSLSMDINYVTVFNNFVFPQQMRLSFEATFYNVAFMEKRSLKDILVLLASIFFSEVVSLCVSFAALLPW